MLNFVSQSFVQIFFILCFNILNTSYLLVKSILRLILFTFLHNGFLGFHIDEERSEMRYVIRIAEPRESSNF